MAWFKRESSEIQASDEKRVRTEGLWQKCEGCRQIIWKKELETNWNVCPKCGQHFRLDAATRLKHLMDGGEFEVHDASLTSGDPLDFHDSKPYSERLAANQQATN